MNITTTTRKSHARKVFECYTAIRDGKNFGQFGRKTREEAMLRYKQEKAEQLGMTLEELENWINEED